MDARRWKSQAYLLYRRISQSLRGSLHSGLEWNKSCTFEESKLCVAGSFAGTIRTLYDA